MTDSLGDIDYVGPYRLVRLLGGGMSSVFEAVHCQEGRRVALKLLRDAGLSGPGQRRSRFDAEVRALRRARHPSLPVLLDSGEVDGTPYLCVPYLAGRTLAETIDVQREAGQPGPVPFDDGLRGLLGAFAEVADALHSLHEVGLVHRDVKPANLLIDTAGRPWLLDLGLVRDADDEQHRLTRTGEVVGTPAFLAPEQVDPSFGQVGRWTDVHGLGATLFAALTLMPPFEAVTPARIFDRILDEAPPDPRLATPAVPKHVATLLRRTLAKDPRDRQPTARHLARDLRRVAAGAAPAPAPRAWLGRTLRALRRSMRRRHRRFSVGAVALMVVAAFPGDAAQRVRPPLAMHEVVDALAELATRHVPLAPQWPETVPECERWLRTAADALRDAADLQREVRPEDPGERAALDALAARARAIEREQMPQVRETLRQARGFEEHVRTLDADLWSRAAQALRVDSRFRGFSLAPQWGLVPLGPDPTSGLWEFHDLASAASGAPTPDRDARGALALAPEHGIVLVLVPAPPGGTPFLVGKHETTRVQWRRLSGAPEPNRYAIGELGGIRFGPRDPVLRATWQDAVVVLARHGLSLPTLAQWLHAATAGSTAPVPGDGRPVAGYANLLDLSLARRTGVDSGATGDDGFAMQAPVGSLAPNPFGVHDAFGNAAEWIADACRPLDGTATRRLMGGAFSQSLSYARTDQVWTSAADAIVEWAGVRVVREVR